MGTMENHVWSVIAKRMKHGHRSWSHRGGNHLAKILAKKCSRKLNEVTERLKGYEYLVIGHVVGLDGKIQGERKRLLYMAGY